MRFINKTTGVVLEPSSEFVVEQMKKSVDYEELKIAKKEETKKVEPKKTEPKKKVK